MHTQDMPVPPPQPLNVPNQKKHIKTIINFLEGKPI